MTILLCSRGQLQAQETAVVLLEPHTLTLDEGQTSGVVVRIEDAVNVYGVQIALSFDAQKIKVLDGDEAKPGVQILSGDFLAVDEGFVAANEANNETGQLTYALSLLFPADPAFGAGTLVEFEVEALETGRIDLLLDAVILASPEGAELPVQLPDDPAISGDIIVPTAAATETTPPTAPAAEDSPVTATPTAGYILTPTSAAESAAAAVPVATSPDAGNRRLPTAAETATLETSGDLSTRSVPVQTAAAETDEAVANTNTVEATKVDRAAEIAAAPPLEKEDSIEVEERPSPVLTVIGQNRDLAEIQDQPAAPAPSASGEGIMEEPYFAIGLVLLIVALIATWFLRRLLSKTE